MNAQQHKQTARVLLHEARVRRGAPFSDVLLRWAGNARRRAMCTLAQGTQGDQRAASQPMQRDLFA